MSLVVSHLKKSYGKKVVVEDLSFTMERPGVYALLGTNGAGKTTSIRMMLNMLSRDGGETWDVDWIIDDECPNWDLGYPATVELKDGSLMTIYYQNVDGISRIMQRVWKLPE